MAKLLEAKFLDSKPHSSHFSRANSTPPSTPSLLGPPPTNPTFPIKRLSPTEMNERRAKGLCFNCDDKFSPGHRCKSKQFLLLLVDDSEPNISTDLAIFDLHLVEPDPIITHTPESENSPPPCEHFQLSRAALVGSLVPKTLRAQGLVRELEVTILVDSGSSHNIMQPQIAEFLQLPIQPITPFSVVVGNGESITCVGSCSDVPVKLSGETFFIPFYIFPSMEQTWY